MRIIVIIDVVIFLLFGCAENFRDVKPYYAFGIHSSETFKGYYYIGSDSEYHFFISKWSPGFDEKFKIGKNNLSINNEFPFNRKCIQIYLYPVDDNSYEEFCRIDMKDIYKNQSRLEKEMFGDESETILYTKMVQ